MIFKLLNYTVLGIALFYAAEGTGVIEKYKYFPTLPRLEASASDPMAWLGAAQWGFSQMGALAQSRGGGFDTGSLGQVTSGYTTGSLQAMAENISGHGSGTRNRLLSAYYR